MVQQQRLRPLIEGALLAAITALFGMLSLNLPLVSFFTDFLWGVPIVIVFIRHGWRIGLMALTVAGMLTLMFTEPVMAGLLFLQLAPVAVVYGVMFRNRFPAGPVLLSGIVMTVIAEAVVLVLYFYTQRSVFNLNQEIGRMTGYVIEIYRTAGVLEHFARQGMDEPEVRKLIGSVIILLPGFFVVAAMIKALLSYLVSVRVLDRLGLGRFRLPAFGEWHLPWYSVWVFMSGLLLTLAGDLYKMPVLAAIGKNIVFICFPIFFIIGLAVGVHFFRRWLLPGWVKILLVVIAVLNLTGTVLLLTGLGVFDPLVTFRSRGKKQDQ
ncbi:MAG: YybS family protein [Bacillota bacterium]